MGLKYRNQQTLDVPLKEEYQKLMPSGQGQLFYDNVIQEI